MIETEDWTAKGPRTLEATHPCPGRPRIPYRMCPCHLHHDINFPCPLHLTPTCPRLPHPDPHNPHNPPSHPSRTQRVPEDVLDAVYEVLMQASCHPLKVSAGQDDDLMGVRLQPLGDLGEGALGTFKEHMMTYLISTLPPATPGSSPPPSTVEVGGTCVQSTDSSASHPAHEQSTDPGTAPLLPAASSRQGSGADGGSGFIPGVSL